MTEEHMNRYIYKCKLYIQFMISQQQWTGIKRDNISRWINNFTDSTLEEQYLAYKLLVHIIYYSEIDIENILKESLHFCLYKDAILCKQLNANFQLSDHALSTLTKDILKETVFIPLLSSESPHESGNYISRILVQKSIINPSQSIFSNKLATHYQRKPFKRLVIVDDCIGSGQQLRDFWKDASVTLSPTGETVLLREFCKTFKIEVTYLSLFAYDENVKILEDEMPDLKIYCARRLDAKHRVWASNSYIWDDAVEREKAFSFFQELTQICGIPLYGYRQLDFAFIMHQTIPDWTLPLFWKKGDNWDILMERKNTYV